MKIYRIRIDVITKSQLQLQKGSSLTFVAANAAKNVNTLLSTGSVKVKSASRK